MPMKSRIHLGILFHDAKIVPGFATGVLVPVFTSAAVVVLVMRFSG